MFEKLSDKLVDSLRKFSGQKKITEENIAEVIKDIRLSLLEADVNFKVAKSFIDRVKEKSVGQEVIKGVNPGQQFTKIIHDELVTLLGVEAKELNIANKPSFIFLVGLQGAGKTTTAGKLSLYIKNKLQKKVGLVPADVYRPAAITQLKTLAEQVGVPVFDSQANQKPQDIVKNAKSWATQNDLDVIIVDTAGRLQIDEDLMTELSDLKSLVSPQEIILVADAMLGQQAVNVAEGFHSRLGLSGLILTKVDGDARGGAALSIRETIGIPIKFLGQGEKLQALEVFHPDRLASRILDMGDVLSLVEKAQEVIDEKQAEESAKKMMKGEFTVEDFLKQIRMMKKMGSFQSILGMMPGMGQMMKQMKDMTPPDEEIKKIEAIICSMTPYERRDSRVLSGSRVVRIAKGSGTAVKDVNKFLKQFEQSKKMMSALMKMGMGGGLPGLGGGKLPF